MSFEYLIAKRYLIQKKETGFITLITYISIAGLSIGISALVLTLAILNGFEQTIKDKVLSFQPHLRVDTFHLRPIGNYEEIQDRLMTYPEVSAVSQFIEQVCILRFGSLEDGIMVRGIIPEMMQDVIDIRQFVRGGLPDLEPGNSGIPGLILGSDIAERFAIKTGDEIILASPAGLRADVAGRPRRNLFEVRGLIDTGMSEFDNSFAFILLSEAQSLFSMKDQITGFGLRLSDVSDVQMIRRTINDDIGYPFFARSWLDTNNILFDWIRVQRLPILIAFGMIILVGTLNLVSTLILIVLEKQKDIGILKSMGASSGSIIKIFFIDGIIIGLFAIGSGSGLALLLGYLQNKYELISLSKDVYYISTFTVDLNLTVFIQIGMVAMLLCLGATVYPAWKAAGSRPYESIRLDW